MDALNASQKAILDEYLENRYSSLLYPLIRPGQPEQNRTKNIARSLSAFFIERTFGVSAQEAAQCVYDDFDDFGVDAVYCDASAGETKFFLIQSKYKETEPVKQPEILAFKQGVEKILNQDFRGLNENLLRDEDKIKTSLDEADEIILVIAHAGPGLNSHAEQAINEFIRDARESETRLRAEYLDFGALQIYLEMQNLHSNPKIESGIEFEKLEHITSPRATYIGVIQLAKLIALHNIHDKFLYERNIRTYLGHKTDVNTSIRETLKNNPSHFLYMNNGIAALCEEIKPKGPRKVKVRGLSVINGAQTIASSAKFAQDNPTSDISTARVTLTLIKANATDDFGKQVTKARNHQNSVRDTNFSALDDRQEEFRKSLALLGYKYIYRAGASEAVAPGSQSIHINSVALALSLFKRDPRYAIWAKRDSLILDPSTTQYQAIFNDALTAHQIVNAHHLWAFGSTVLNDAASAASGQERLVYRHGRNAILWIAAMRYLRSWERLTRILSSQDIGSIFSCIIDDIRQDVFDEYQRTHGYKGPLAYFGNMSDTLGLLEKVMIRRFDLVADPAIAPQQAIANLAEGYNMRLFDYMINHAPEIGVPA